MMRREYDDAETPQRHQRLDARWIVAPTVAISILLLILIVPVVFRYHTDYFYAESINRLFLVIGCIIGIIGCAIAFVWTLGYYNRIASKEAARADKVIALTVAQQQRFPSGLKSLSFHDSSKQLAPAIVEEDVPGALPQAVPTFAELLSSNSIGARKPLLLGIDTESGEKLTGSWLDLYSTAVAGMSGSGKSTSQRFFACQTALHGAKFAVIDPHADAGEDSLAASLAPLNTVFLAEPASDDKAILETVKLIADIGKRRINGDRSRAPIILWIDELTMLLNRSKVAEPLALLIEEIAQEYRKASVFVACSGQIWTANRTGDSSALRDSFASVLAHRMKRGQARLLLPTDEAQLVERLEPGHAVLWRTSGATATIAVPNTTAHDVVRVAGLLTADSPTMTRLTAADRDGVIVGEGVATCKPESSQKVAETVRLHSAPESEKAVSAEAARAAALFLGGMTKPAELVWNMRQIRSSQGARYQQALAEVMDLVREGIEAMR